MMTALVRYYREVSYQLILDIPFVKENPKDGTRRRCDGIEGSDEAIEFAMRTSSSSAAPWIPLRIDYPDDSATTNIIRGYTVVQAVGSLNSVRQVHICGDLLHHASEIQFRWMGSATAKSSDQRDIWALGSVTATLVASNKTLRIFEDSFGSEDLK